MLSYLPLSCPYIEVLSVKLGCHRAPYLIKDILVIKKIIIITIIITMKIMGVKQWIFHGVALLVHYFQVELDFGMLVFVTGEKPEDPGKNPRSKDDLIIILPSIRHSGWKASVFTSAPASPPIKDLSKFTRRSIEVGRTDTSAHWTRAINPLF